jgi:hypothetical protein
MRSSGHILLSLLPISGWVNRSLISWLLFCAVRFLWFFAYFLMASVTYGMRKSLCKIRFDISMSFEQENGGNWFLPKVGNRPQTTWHQSQERHSLNRHFCQMTKAYCWKLGESYYWPLDNVLCYRLSSGWGGNAVARLSVEYLVYLLAFSHRFLKPVLFILCTVTQYKHVTRFSIPCVFLYI